MFTKDDAHREFLARFVWNDQDTVVLKARDESEAAPCAMGEWPFGHPTVERAGTLRMFDYEDETSGGTPLCPECFKGWVEESKDTVQPDWVTSDPEGAWSGILQAEGNGWSGLWPLFTPVGMYSRSEGTWPL